jgi:hypothetical protein
MVSSLEDITLLPTTNNNILHSGGFSCLRIALLFKTEQKS